ncbi:hypothetical protein ACTXT7_015399 [Hymenolepis weldensis]
MLLEALHVKVQCLGCQRRHRGGEFMLPTWYRWTHTASGRDVMQQPYDVIIALGLLFYYP